MFSGQYETPTPDMYKAVLRDNERLRHDIERHIAIASELATENERLRTTLERLREYARHTPACYWWSGTINQPHPCDCGYDALMADLEYK